MRRHSGHTFPAILAAFSVVAKLSIFKGAGSTSAHPITKDEIEAISGPYLDFARSWIPESVETSSRAKVEPADLAIALPIGDCSIATGAHSKIARQEQGESTWDPLNACELAPNSANSLIPSLIAWAKSQPPGNVAIVSPIVKYCSQKRNADSTMPTRRIKVIWDRLFAEGEVDRAFDYHRWRVIRNLIEVQGGLEMEDRHFGSSVLKCEAWISQCFVVASPFVSMIRRRL